MQLEHFIEQCPHGTIVSQCRCMDRDKPVRVVPCPAWCETRQKAEREATTPKKLGPITEAGPYATSEAAG
jgi:hypothetical protein